MTKAKVYDLIAGVPQILLNGATIAGILIAWSLRPSGAGGPGIDAVLTSLSDITRIIFLCLLIFLLLSRRTPVNAARGPWPKIWALIGLFFTAIVAAFPHAPLGRSTQILSLVLTGVGTVASIYVTIYLGRSFSIFPQARGLVTAGPYKFVRHPLYLAEWIAVFGMALQFTQPWALLIAAASILVQLPRMRYEEAVLSETYPQYKTYRATTARLIPGIY
jgi:protein-S-isoprenylcysteine O-methyltransferase Ste14